MSCPATPPATTKRPRPCFYRRHAQSPRPHHPRRPPRPRRGAPTHLAGDRPAPRAHPRARAPDRGHGAHAPARPPPAPLARRRRHPRRLLARPTRHAPTCDTVGAAPRRQGMRGPRDAANGTDGPEGARTTPRPPPASGRSASPPSCARPSPAPSPTSSPRSPMPPRPPFPSWPRSSPRPSSVPMWPSPSCSSSPFCASCIRVPMATASPPGRAARTPRSTPYKGASSPLQGLKSWRYFGAKIAPLALKTWCYA